MTTYNIIKTIDGHHFGNVIAKFDNIEDAKAFINSEWEWIENGDCEPTFLDGIREDGLSMRYDNYTISIEEVVETEDDDDED